MSAPRAVARGAGRLLAGTLLARALDFCLFLLLARTLGVERFGAHAFALSFVLLFTVVADLGVMTVFVREVERTPRRARGLLRDAVALKAGLGLLTLAGTLGLAAGMGMPGRTLGLVALFTLGLLCNSGALLFAGLLRTAGRAGLACVSLLCQSATAFAVGWTLLAAGAGVVAGAGAYLCGSVVHLATAGALARRAWRRWSAEVVGAAEPACGADCAGCPALACRSTWTSRLAMLREAAPLALGAAFIALCFRIDAVLLRLLVGERAVGLYGGIYPFFAAFVLLSAAYRSVLFPLMTRAADGPADALAALCRKSLRLQLLFTVGVATFITLQAPAILATTLGPPYATAAPGLAILAWALPGAYMADTLLHLLAAQRRRRLAVGAVGAAVAFNLVLNLALIPRLSFVGAAIATVASVALCFALLLATLRAAAPAIGLTRLGWKPLAAGLAPAATLAPALGHWPEGMGGLVAAAAAAAAAYALILVALRAVGREDVRLVASLLAAARRRIPDAGA